MKRIFIIGAGQLGSRHLQALKNVSNELTINVIDPSAESLKIAKERYESFDGINSHNVSYNLSMMDIDKKDSIDIVIIASNSNVRFKITKELLDLFTVKVIVFEKILFNKKENYFDTINLLRENKVIAYVNCCMRMMSFYNDIKSYFVNTKFTYIVSGSKFGLVTNLPHFIDHIAFLSNDKIYTPDTSLLDKKIIESKRKGFYEMTGTYQVKFKSRSHGVFNCFSDGDAPIVIEAFNNKFRFISRESEGKIYVSKSENDWKWEEINFSIPYQSELTTTMVNDILNDLECKLPSFEESVEIHIPFLESLKDYMNEKSELLVNEYPFT